MVKNISSILKDWNEAWSQSAMQSQKVIEMNVGLLANVTREIRNSSPSPSKKSEIVYYQALCLSPIPPFTFSVFSFWA